MFKHTTSIQNYLTMLEKHKSTTEMLKVNSEPGMLIKQPLKWVMTTMSTKPIETNKLLSMLRKQLPPLLLNKLLPLKMKLIIKLRVLSQLFQRKLLFQSRKLLMHEPLFFSNITII